jgi:ABC-type multidrug transport system fused ATPase/permease subunit
MCSSFAEAFGWLVRQTAGAFFMSIMSIWAHFSHLELENDMNSAERILHYANEIEQEAPSQRPENKPPPEWPQSGQISIDDISLRYRPGLPLVLKNITVNVKAGEKIGIVGRYVCLWDSNGLR